MNFKLKDLVANWKLLALFVSSWDLTEDEPLASWCCLRLLNNDKIHVHFHNDPTFWRPVNRKWGVGGMGNQSGDIAQHGKKKHLILLAAKVMFQGWGDLEIVP